MVSKNDYVSTLNKIQRGEIRMLVTLELGLGNGKDVEKAMNSRICDLEEIIDINKLSTVKFK